MSGGLSLVVLMPRGPLEPLETLERALDPTTFLALLRRAARSPPRATALSLPRLRLDLTLDVVPLVHDMGKDSSDGTTGAGRAAGSHRSLCRDVTPCRMSRAPPLGVTFPRVPKYRDVLGVPLPLVSPETPRTHEPLVSPMSPVPRMCPALPSVPNVPLHPSVPKLPLLPLVFPAAQMSPISAGFPVSLIVPWRPPVSPLCPGVSSIPTVPCVPAFPCPCPSGFLCIPCVPGSPWCPLRPRCPHGARCPGVPVCRGCGAEAGAADFGLFLDAELCGLARGPAAVDSARHRAVLALDEAGMEAAAAMATSVARSALVLEALRPFLFVLWHNTGDFPVFMGRLSDP